jgi:hypothetical protein
MVKGPVLVLLSMAVGLANAGTPIVPDEDPLVVMDPRGDLRERSSDVSGRSVENLAYVDIVELELGIADGELVVTTRTAGPLPAVGQAQAGASFYIVFDDDGDDLPNQVVVVELNDMWNASIISLAPSAASPGWQAQAVVVGDRLTVRIPLSVLGSPRELGVQILGTAIHAPQLDNPASRPTDPVDQGSFGLEFLGDQVPDGIREWIKLDILGPQ